ncbi:MAG TPA: condensation domain-containing protein, partial [Chitinophagaceae bacterium]|nr:condensation domain-containing protein [Chitinophagaceae bacterium]
MQNRIGSLHPAQREVYLDQLLNTGSPHYNVGGYIRLMGTIDKPALLTAIRSSVHTFDVLRMRFDFTGEIPGCYFDHEAQEPEIIEKNFSSSKRAEEDATHWMQQQFNTPFALQGNARLFEYGIITIRAHEHWLYLRYHHLVTDGYGISVWLQYVAAKYRSLVTGKEQQFSFPAYEEEVKRAAAYRDSADYEADARYWKEKISSKPGKLLTGKYRYNEADGKKSGVHVVTVNNELRKKLDEAVLQIHTSLQQLTIAALIIYFGKITEQSQFIFGLPIHKRRSKQLRSTMGMITGILPFKGEYNPDLTLGEFIQQVVASRKEDYRHQDYPLGELSRWLNTNFYEGYLCEVIINYALLDFSLDFGEKIKAKSYELFSEYGTDPLGLWWRDYGSQQPLELRIDFQFEHFNSREAELLADRILFIIEQFHTSFDKKISEIDIVPPSEHALLRRFNDTKGPYPDRSLAHLFIEQARRTPVATAVVTEDESITYRELDERSNQLAHYLVKKGIQPETLVPVCMDKCVDLMVGVLGVLKAGAAYMPVDPSYPKDRIAFMLEQADAKLVLSNSKSSSKILTRAGATIIELDSTQKAIGGEAVTPPGSLPLPSHLAYVIFTSGSTGQPKGAMIEHRNVVNVNVGWNRMLQLKKRVPVVLSVASISFDVFTADWCRSLLYGGKLVMVPAEKRLDMQYLYEA